MRCDRPVPTRLLHRTTSFPQRQISRFFVHYGGYHSWLCVPAVATMWTWKRKSVLTVPGQHGKRLAWEVFPPFPRKMRFVRIEPTLPQIVIEDFCNKILLSSVTFGGFVRHQVDI
jgi:hypothetical protein